MGRLDRQRRESIQRGEEDSLAFAFGKLRAYQHVALDQGAPVAGNAVTGLLQQSSRCPKCGVIVPLSCVAGHPERCKGRE